MRGIRIYCKEDDQDVSYDYLIADTDTEPKVRKIFSACHKNCTIIRTELMPRADVRSFRKVRFSS